MEDPPAGTHPIVVHAHGRVGTADHVYAHDQIARLQRSLADRSTHCTVDLVDHGDGADGGRTARAELDIDGSTVRAHACGQTVRVAVDKLGVELRRQLQHLDRTI